MFLILLASVPASAAVKLSTITISPGSVTGGSTATGTATLTSAAGHNGAVVTLSSSNTAVATVPAGITIPSGQTSGTFTINTSAVASQANVTITGNLGVNATASFTVMPPVLASFSLDATTVTAGNGTNGTVTLNGPAPAAGIVVTLTSTNSCVQVPASVTVGGGWTSSSFGITTTQVNSTTNVTLLATAGNTQAVTLTVNPCNAQILSTPGAFPISDVIWFDDSLPAGMSLGSATWDTTKAVSGTQALTQPWSTSYHAMTFTGATATLPVYAGESLVSYILNSTCTPAREVILGWHTTAGIWKKAYLGQAVIGGEAGYVNLGTLSVAGNYRRIEVTASSLGLEGATIDGVSMELSDGQAWLDRVGKTCVMPPAAAPTIPSTDIKWIDDGAEGGGQVILYGATVWDTRQHASGAQSLRLGDGSYGTWNNGTIGLDYAALPANVGDRLVIYLLGDTCAPPDELSVSVTTTYGELRRVYWGTPNFSWDSTALYAGPMPATGSWSRLEVSFHDLGIEERAVKAMLLYSHNGIMWIDAVANSGTGCTIPTAAPPTVPSGDTLLMEDAEKPGAHVYGGYWSTAQHATGSASYTSAYAGPGDHWVGIEGNYPRLDILEGENIVFYVLFSQCLPPTQFKVTFSATGGISPIYWGTENPNNGYYMGPMPAPGVWTRVEIPVRLLTTYQYQQLSGLFVYWTDGEFWLDHFGKSGTPCSTALAARPTLPGTDTMWIHENQGGIYYNCNFETTQVAEGSVSFTSSGMQAGIYKGMLFGYQQELAFPVSTGDKLVAYVLIDECATPDELMLQWRTGTIAGGDIAYTGCYWGTPHVGGEGSQFFSMGPLPQPGVWTRLEIPASALGLEGKTVTEIDFYTTNGKSWWDVFGKTP